MRAVKLPARVTKDHTLHLQLPEEIGEGPAEVIVLVPDAVDDVASRHDSSSLAEYLARPRTDTFARSKQELDDEVERLRQSWE